MKVTFEKPDSAPPDVIEDRIIKTLTKSSVLGMHYRKWSAERKRGMRRLIFKGRIDIIGDVYSLRPDTKESQADV